MSVSPSDFGAFAEKLVSSIDEIDLRNAASRSYYAAYHLCQTIMNRCPKNDHLAMGSHERLSERLKLQGTIDARSLQYILLSMKRIRTMADYEISDPFPSRDASAQVSQLKNFETKIGLFAEKFPPL